MLQQNCVIARGVILARNITTFCADSATRVPETSQRGLGQDHRCRQQANRRKTKRKRYGCRSQPLATTGTVCLRLTRRSKPPVAPATSGWVAMHVPRTRTNLEIWHPRGYLLEFNLSIPLPLCFSAFQESHCAPRPFLGCTGSRAYRPATVAATLSTLL